jgi:hypothetical protein
MSKATYPLKLPASIKAAAVRLAKEDGVSLNQWIATAVAQKIGVVETAATFFGAGRVAPRQTISSVSWIRCRICRLIQRTQSRPTWLIVCPI